MLLPFAIIADFVNIKIAGKQSLKRIVCRQKIGVFALCQQP
jgi:hypothetical protein